MSEASEEEALPKVQPRLFINNADKDSSFFLADFLSKFVASEDGEEEEAEEEAEETNREPDEFKDKPLKGFVVSCTFANSSYKKPKFVDQVLSYENRYQFFEHLMMNDVIVYNVLDNNEDQLDEAIWILERMKIQCSNFQSPKTYILLSDLLTWKETKRSDLDDPESAYLEEDFKKRKTLPEYRDRLNAEKMIMKPIKKGKKKFSYYVIGCGALYGRNGLFFKDAILDSWKAAGASELFGEGNNYLPTIHVDDLGKIIASIAYKLPQQKYIVAKDNSRNTLKEIIKAFSDHFSYGVLHSITKAEAIHLRSMTSSAWDLFTLDLPIDAVTVNEELGINWTCENGIVEGVSDLLTKEFIESNKIKANKVMVIGPPESGKTCLSKELCRRYELHRISKEALLYDYERRLKHEAAFSDKIAKMKKSVDDELIADESMEVKSTEVEDHEETQNKVTTLRDSTPIVAIESNIDMSYFPLEYLIPIDWDNLELMETISANAREELIQLEEAKNEKGISDDLLAKFDLPSQLPYIFRIIRKKLQSKPCQNQGYVLDGIPVKVEQVMAVFAPSEERGEEEEKKFSFDSALLPEVVVFLKAEDKTLYQRIKNRYLVSLKSDKSGFSDPPKFYSTDNLDTDPNYQSLLRSFQEWLKEYKCLMNPGAAAGILKRRKGNSKLVVEEEEEEKEKEDEQEEVKEKEDTKPKNGEETEKEIEELIIKLPNDPDSTENNVLVYFDVREVYPLVIDVERDNSDRMLLGKGTQMDTFKKVCKEMGLPSKPLTSSMEDQLLDALFQNKMLEANKKVKADEVLINSILIAEWDNWVQLVRREVTEKRSLQLMPMRHYMMQTAMPKLIDALFECNSIRPKDPIEFIANFMISSFNENK